MEAERAPLPVEVPLAALGEDTLAAVIESFILREGTDYGASEISFETKMSQVRRQLEKGDLRILYDPESESVTIANRPERTAR